MENKLQNVNDSQLAVIRNRRDLMIRDTDWTQFSDSPLTTEQREAFSLYRQALRDVPNHYLNTGLIEWPDKPTV